MINSSIFLLKIYISESIQFFTALSKYFQYVLKINKIINI